MAHNFSLKAVKTFEGNEGIGFSATLYEGNKKVATVLDDAWGGSLQFRFIDPEAEKRLDDVAKSMPRVVDERYSDPDNPGQPLSWQPDADHVVCELFSEYLRDKEEQKIKRQCQKKTIYKLHSDGEGVQRVLDKPFSPKLAEAILQRYGSDLKEIVNERYLSLTGFPKADVSGPVRKELFDTFLKRGETNHCSQAATLWAVTESCREKGIPYRVEALYHYSNPETPAGVRVVKLDSHRHPAIDKWTVKVLEEFTPEVQDAPEEADNDDCGPRM